jgi:hypothetical protein
MCTVSAMMSAVPTATARGRVYCGRSQHHRSEATQEQYEFCAHRLFLGVYTLYTPKREESRYFPPATENLAATVDGPFHSQHPGIASSHLFR